MQKLPPSLFNSTATVKQGHIQISHFRLRPVHGNRCHFSSTLPWKFYKRKIVRTAHGLASATKLLPLLNDPDILLASRPVLPWSQGQRMDKSDGDSERVSKPMPNEREREREVLAFPRHMRTLDEHEIARCAADGTLYRLR